MKLILRDRNQELVDEWKKQFWDTDVEIGCGDIFDVPADAIVSPANSWGWMNGGIDLAYSQRFGWTLQENLQKYLSEHHDCELLVGEAVFIPIANDPAYKMLISAPTMRVPMVVAGTPNAFLAMRAILRLVKKYNEKAINKAHLNTVQWGKFESPQTINTVLCPGLGTAIGKMPYAVAAHQMREAYRIVAENKPPTFDDIGDSYNYHMAMIRGLNPIGG